MPESHKPDVTVAGSTRRLASRYYQLMSGHCRTGQYLHWARSARPPVLVGEVSEAEIREWEEEQGAEAEEPGAGGGATTVPPHAGLHRVRRRSRGAGALFLGYYHARLLVSSFYLFTLASFLF